MTRRFTDDDIGMLITLLRPTTLERVAGWLVDWGYDTQRYDGLPDDTVLPDTGGLRSWVADRADAYRVWSIRRRRARCRDT